MVDFIFDVITRQHIGECLTFHRINCTLAGMNLFFVVPFSLRTWSAPYEKRRNGTMLSRTRLRMKSTKRSVWNLWRRISSTSVVPKTICNILRDGLCTISIWPSILYTSEQLARARKSSSRASAETTSHHILLATRRVPTCLEHFYSSSSKR